MPDISPFRLEIIYVHLIGVFIFLLAHGVSAGVLLRLRSERDPGAVRTLLDLSRRSFTVMSVGALIWLAGGLLAGFAGNWWTSGSYWIWVALALTIVIIGVMTPFGRLYFNRVRAAVGMDPRTGAITDPAATVDPAALEAAISTGRPLLVASLGIGGIIVLAWLMMFKPF
jgi:hypothetical protein